MRHALLVRGLQRHRRLTHVFAAKSDGESAHFVHESKQIAPINEFLYDERSSLESASVEDVCQMRGIREACGLSSK